jgi:hypothetical protein
MRQGDGRRRDGRLKQSNDGNLRALVCHDTFLARAPSVALRGWWASGRTLPFATSIPSTAAD